MREKNLKGRREKFTKKREKIGKKEKWSEPTYV